MARGKRAAEAAQVFDAPEGSELDTLIEQQRDLLQATLGQWTQSQQALASAWFQWLDSVYGTLYGAWRVPGWAGAPEDLMLAGPRMLQAVWAPWAPYVERGGEQLG